MMARMAMQALAQNKLRTFLTTLGIIIGVASVIAMVALGQGASASVQARIAGLGVNVLTVFGGSATTGGARQGSAAVESLRAADVEAIRRECPSVRLLSPQLRRSAQVIAGDNNWATGLQGVDTAYFRIREWTFATGSAFEAIDTTVSAKVCVLGETVRQQLFGNADPVGAVVRVNQVPLRVVGVLTPRGQTSFGQDQDDAVFIPYTTFMNRLYGTDRFSMIVLSAVSPEEVDAARAEVTSLLRQRHHIRASSDDDFYIRTQQEIAQAAEQTTAIFTLLLGGIAAVSLVVGGIGIMNIMLVSVTERTREIGVRLAVGAHRRDILVQFFTEALVLSVLGGLAGILVGAIAVWVVRALSPWAPIMTVSSVLVAFFCASAVGLLSGYYPARKAAHLDPIEALRHE